MADDECVIKKRELERYIPFIEKMIIELKDPKRKNREAQLKKMESLHSMITDKSKRWKLDTLKKCEEVLVKLYEKVHPGKRIDSPATIANSVGNERRDMTKFVCKNPPEEKLTSTEIINTLKLQAARARLSELSTPASPSPPRELPPTHTPVVIPTEKVSLRQNINHDEFNIPLWNKSYDERFKTLPPKKLDVYSQAAQSLSTTDARPFLFDKIENQILSKPPLTEKDLEDLQSSADFTVVTEAESMSLVELEDLREKLKKKLGDNVEKKIKEDLLTRSTPKPVPVPSSAPKATTHSSKSSSSSKVPSSVLSVTPKPVPPPPVISGLDGSSKLLESDTTKKAISPNSSLPTNEKVKAPKKLIDLDIGFGSIDKQILGEEKKKERRESGHKSQDKKKDGDKQKDEKSSKKRDEKDEKHKHVDTLKEKDVQSSKERHDKKEHKGDKDRRKSEEKIQISDKTKSKDKGEAKDKVETVNSEPTSDESRTDKNNDVDSAVTKTDRREKDAINKERCDAREGREMSMTLAGGKVTEPPKDTRSIYERFNVKPKPKMREPTDELQNVEREKRIVEIPFLESTQNEKEPSALYSSTSDSNFMNEPKRFLKNFDIPSPWLDPISSRPKTPPAWSVKMPELNNAYDTFNFPPKNLQPENGNIRDPFFVSPNESFHSSVSSQSNYIPSFERPDSHQEMVPVQSDIVSPTNRLLFPNHNNQLNYLNQQSLVSSHQRNTVVNNFIIQQNQMNSVNHPFSQTPYGGNIGQAVVSLSKQFHPFEPISEPVEPSPIAQQNNYDISRMQPIDFYHTDTVTSQNHHQQQQRASLLPTSQFTSVNDPYGHKDPHCGSRYVRNDWQNQRDPRLRREDRDLSRVSGRDDREALLRCGSRGDREFVRINPRDPREREKEISRQPQRDGSFAARERYRRMSYDQRSSDRRGPPRYESRNKYDEVYSKLDKSKEGETFASPLDSLYTSSENQTGRGYGVQKYKIPRKKNTDENAHDKEKGGEAFYRQREIGEDERSARRKTEDVVTLTKGKEDEEIEMERGKLKKDTVDVNEPPVLESKKIDFVDHRIKDETAYHIETKQSPDIAKLQKSETVGKAEPAEFAKEKLAETNEKNDKIMISDFINSLIGEKKKKDLLLAIFNTLADGLEEQQKKKFNRIIVDSDSSEEESGIKNKTQKQESVEESTKKEECTVDIKGEIGNDESVHKENKEEKSESIAEEQTVISPEISNKPKKGSRKKSVAKKSSPSGTRSVPVSKAAAEESKKEVENKQEEEEEVELEVEDAVFESVGERIKSRRRNVQPQKKKYRKSRTELDMLHEDIKDMFIRDGVLTATGKRMCRILKDDPDALTKTAGPKPGQQENKYNKTVSKKEKENANPHPPSPGKRSSRNQLRVVLEKTDLSKLVTPKAEESSSSDESDFDVTAGKKLRSRSRKSSINNKCEQATMDIDQASFSPKKSPRSSKTKPNYKEITEDEWKNTSDVVKNDEEKKEKEEENERAEERNWNDEEKGKEEDNLKKEMERRDEEKSKEEEKEIESPKKSARKKRRGHSWALGNFKKQNKKKKASQDTVSRAGSYTSTLSERTEHSIRSDLEEEEEEKRTGDEGSREGEESSKSLADDNELSEDEFVEPDVNYYYGMSEKPNCKLCPFKGKFIIHHYRQQHKNHEVMISRLPPEMTEEAVKESLENDYGKIEPTDLLEGKNRRKKFSFQCRFCRLVFKRDYAENFFNHVSLHTGEYRFRCDFCDFLTSSPKAIKGHYIATHSMTVEEHGGISAAYPPPPNFNIVFGHVCGECNYLQLNKTSVEEHVKIYHLGNDTKIYKISMSSKLPDQVIEPEAEESKEKKKRHVQANAADRKAIEDAAEEEKEPISNELKDGDSPVATSTQTEEKRTEEPESKESNVNAGHLDIESGERMTNVTTIDDESENFEEESAALSSKGQQRKSKKQGKVCSKGKKTAVEPKAEIEKQDQGRRENDSANVETSISETSMETQSSANIVAEEIEHVQNEKNEAKDDQNSTSKAVVEGAPSAPEPNATDAEKTNTKTVDESELPKDKQVDKNVFTCDKEITEQEQRIEEERLKKMEEINQTVSQKRLSLSLTEKLRTLLDASSSSCSNKSDETSAKNEENVNLVTEVIPSRSDLSKNREIQVLKVSKPSQLKEKFEKRPLTNLLSKNNTPITNIIQRLQGKLDTEPTSSSEIKSKPPPLLRLSDLSPLNQDEEETFQVGPVEGKNDKECMVYGCLVDYCVFKTTLEDVFEDHCKERHPNKEWDGFCKICDKNIATDDSAIPLNVLDAFGHLVKTHVKQGREASVDGEDEDEGRGKAGSGDDNVTEEQEKREEKDEMERKEEKVESSEKEVVEPPKISLRVRRLSGDTLSKTGNKQDETRNDVVERNSIELACDKTLPFSFKIASVETDTVEAKEEEHNFPFQISCVTTLTPEQEKALESSELVENEHLTKASSPLRPNRTVPVISATPNASSFPVIKNIGTLSGGKVNVLFPITLSAAVSSHSKGPPVLVTATSTTSQACGIVTATGTATTTAFPTQTEGKKRVTLREIPLSTAESSSKPKKSEYALSCMLSPHKLKHLYKCPEFNCPFTTAVNRVFADHMKKHPEILKNQTTGVPCLYCNFKVTLDQYILHVDVRHGKCEFGCTMCFYRAVCQSYVQIHAEEAHPEQKVMVVKMPVQPSNAKTATSMPHLKEMIMPYECAHCPYKVLFVDEYFYHVKVRHQDLPVKCPRCMRHFKIVPTLIQHLRVHSIYPYHCRYCTVGASSVADVYKHLASKHPANPPDIVGRRFIPDYTGRSPEEYNYNGEEVYSRLNRIVTENSKWLDPTLLKDLTEGVISVRSTTALISSIDATQKKIPFVTAVTTAPTTGSTNSSTSVDPADSAESIVIPVSSPQADATPRITDTGEVDTNGSSGNGDRDLQEKQRQEKGNVPDEQQQQQVFVADLEDLNEEAAIGPDEEAIDAVNKTANPKEPATAEKDPLEISASDLENSQTNFGIEMTPSYFSESDSQNFDFDLAFEDGIEEGSKGSSQGLSGWQLFKCENCNLGFENSTQFRAHVNKCFENKGETIKPYRCAHCSKCFKTAYALVDHVRVHGTAKYTCSLCDYVCRSKTYVHNHMKARHKMTSYVVNPVDPTKRDGDKDEFIVKPKVFSKQQQQQSSTDVQDKGSGSANVDDLKGSDSKIMKTTFSPQEIHLLPRQAVYSVELKCAECPYSTKVKTNLVRHLQMHESEKEVPVNAPVNPVPCLDKNEKMFDKMINLAFASNTGCSKAGSKATDKSGLTKEEEAQLPAFVPMTKRFVCGASGCNYLCLEEAMLRHHLLALHAHEFDYKCKHCEERLSAEKGGINVDQVMKHFKLHDLHLYKCGYCKFVHHLRHKVDRHVSEKHFDKPSHIIVVREMENEPQGGDEAAGARLTEEVKEAKPWRCGMCKYRCSTRNEMVAHAYNKHEMNSQYKCALCAYKTASKDSFGEHFASRHPGQAVDIIDAFYKVEEIQASKGADSEPFDTTPLWQRDRPRVRHIRGILFDESGKIPKKSPFKIVTTSSSGGSSILSNSPSSNNLDKAIEAVATGMFSVVEGAEGKEQSGNKSKKKIPENNSNKGVANVEDEDEIIEINDDSDEEVSASVEATLSSKAIPKELQQKQQQPVTMKFDSTPPVLVVNPPAVLLHGKATNSNASNTTTAPESSVPVLLTAATAPIVSTNTLASKSSTTAAIPSHGSGSSPTEMKETDLKGRTEGSSKSRTELADINVSLQEIMEMPAEKLMHSDLMGTYGPYGKPFNRQFLCPLCAKFKTKNPKDITHHLYKELDYSRYTCTECGRKAVTYDFLSRHALTNHKNFTPNMTIRSLSPEPQIENWVQTVLLVQRRIIAFTAAAAVQTKHPQPPPLLPRHMNEFVQNDTFVENDSGSESNFLTKMPGCATIRKGSESSSSGLDCDSMSGLANTESNKPGITTPELSSGSTKEQEDAIGGDSVNLSLVEDKDTASASYLPKMQHCAHCDYKCKAASDLRKHEKRHWAQKPLKCGYCDFEGVTNYEIQSHQKRAHKGREPSIILIPTPSSPTIRPITRKRKYPEPSDDTEKKKKFLFNSSAEISSTVCGDAQILENLLGTGSEKEETLEDLQCHYCPKRTLGIEEMRTHWEIVHKPQQRPFEYKKYQPRKRIDVRCDYCGAGGSISHMRKHHVVVHPQLELRLYRRKCARCDQLFLRLEDFKNHKSDCSPEKTKLLDDENDPFVDVEAEDSTGTSSVKLLTVAAKEFVCTLCYKYFQHRWQLVQHNNTYHQTQADISLKRPNAEPEGNPSKVIVLSSSSGSESDADNATVIKMEKRGGTARKSTAKPSVSSTRIKVTARKSTARSTVTPPDGYSFYGNKPDSTDLKKITATVPFMASNVQMNVGNLSKIVQLFPQVLVNDCEKSNSEEEM